MTERYLRTMDDIREEQEALLERQLDPDMALASDYVVGALSDVDAANVRARIQKDPDFADLIEPLLVAFEHGRTRTRLSPEDRRRKLLELRRRIGLPDTANVPAGPDRAMEGFRAELEKSKRASRRRTMWTLAATLVLVVLPPTAITIAKWKRVDTSRTPWGSTQNVDLLAGSSATLAMGTRLVKLGDFGQTDRFVMLSGNATFDVAPSDLAPVVVRTQSAEITVTGTTFTVHAYDFEPTEIIVHRGSVSVRARNADGALFGPSLSVSAGQRARAVRGYPPVLIP